MIVYGKSMGERNNDVNHILSILQKSQKTKFSVSKLFLNNFVELLHVHIHGH